MDRVVEVARDRLSLERGVSVLCRAFFIRLYTTCFGWEIENNDAKGWTVVEEDLSLSLDGYCYGGVGIYDKVIS